jgi:hypothetical protein
MEASHLRKAFDDCSPRSLACFCLLDGHDFPPPAMIVGNVVVCLLKTRSNSLGSQGLVHESHSNRSRRS